MKYNLVKKREIKWHNGFDKDYFKIHKTLEELIAKKR